MSYLGNLNPYMTQSNYAEEMRKRNQMLTGPKPAPQMSMNPVAPESMPDMSPNTKLSRQEQIASMIRNSNQDMTADDNALDYQRDYAKGLLATKDAGPRQLGNVVVNNPWEGLSVGLSRGLGGYMMGKAAEKDKELQVKRDEIADSKTDLAAFTLGNQLDQQDTENTIARAGLEEAIRKTAYDRGKDLTNWEKEGRRDFTKVTANFREIDDSYGKIIAASDIDQQTPQTQMSLIFSYMKMLDPGSTVREGEFATAEQTTGIPGMVKNAYNRALAGEFLGDDQILGFRNAAGDIYKNSLNAFDADLAYYTGLAEDQGADPKRVARDFARFRNFGEKTPPPADTTKLVRPSIVPPETWDLADDEQKLELMKAANGGGV
jgi:hypothetical protein